jgi:hypothetical protein
LKELLGTWVIFSVYSDVQECLYSVLLTNRKSIET